MTPYTNKEVLCKELSKMVNAYPILTVKDLTAETKNCQDAYYKAIQIVSYLINNGNNGGSVATIGELNIKKLSFSIYQWDEFERRHKLISSTPETFKESIAKVERLKSSNSITKILVGGYSEKKKQYFYFDLKGNAYTFPVDVKLSREWQRVA